MALKWNGTGDTWVSTFSALPYPGAYAIELTDVGGNVLASGTLTVRCCSSALGRAATDATDGAEPVTARRLRGGQQVLDPVELARALWDKKLADML